MTAASASGYDEKYKKDDKKDNKFDKFNKRTLRRTPSSKKEQPRRRNLIKKRTTGTNRRVNSTEIRSSGLRRNTPRHIKMVHTLHEMV